MHGAIWTLIAVTFLPAADPAAAFLPQRDYDADLVIKPQIGHHLMRAHVEFTGAAGEQAFARVRTNRKVEGGMQTLLDEHSLPLVNDRETCEFYFRVPRFDEEEVTIEVEVGIRRRGEIAGDQLLTWDDFTIRPEGGDRYSFGDSDLPPPISRLAIDDDGVRKPLGKPADRQSRLRKRLIRQFDGRPVEGPQAAVRLEPLR